LATHTLHAQNITDLVRRLQATSDLQTRFLQKKAECKTKTAELATANEALRAQRQTAELAQREVNDLTEQLKFDKSAAELRRLKDSESALKSEKEQLERKLAVC
jgi:hypothetical protein